MGEFGIFLIVAPGVAVVLILMGATACCRGVVPLGGTEIHGKSARWIGIFAIAAGLLIPLLIYSSATTHLNTARWLQALGVTLAIVGLVLALYPFRFRNWAALAWGGLLLLIGVLTISPPQQLERALMWLRNIL